MDDFGSYQQGSGTQQGVNEPSYDKTYDQCKPAIVALFMGFKLIPTLLYFILWLATEQHFLIFMITSLLFCADFWVTKNIAGRQLAALFWYSKLTEDNQEKWCFESSNRIVASACNRIFFWIGQFAIIVIWVILLLLNLILLDFFYVFLSIFCLVLLITNFALFLECKGEHQKRANSITKKFGVQLFELNEQSN